MLISMTAVVCTLVVQGCSPVGFQKNVNAPGGVAYPGNPGITPHCAPRALPDGCAGQNWCSGQTTCGGGTCAPDPRCASNRADPVNTGNCFAPDLNKVCRDEGGIPRPCFCTGGTQSNPTGCAFTCNTCHSAGGNIVLGQACEPVCVSAAGAQYLEGDYVAQALGPGTLCMSRSVCGTHGTCMRMPGHCGYAGAQSGPLFPLPGYQPSTQTSNGVFSCGRFNGAANPISAPYRCNDVNHAEIITNPNTPQGMAQINCPGTPGN